MATFDECCVLIPASSLEDFPTRLSEVDASSLLASWTVLWHPALLADSGQIPVWYRADGPPDPLGNRLIAVSHPCFVQLPEDYQRRVGESESGFWLTGDDREQMLRTLAESYPDLSLGTDKWLQGRRRIDVHDFFAAGYTALQIQIMTRRLRYTSNLDEVHLQTRAVEAARAFLNGNADEAIDGLHDVFDALAEERDHYFSSDPHLIDLYLTSRSTESRLLKWWEGAEAEIASAADASRGESESIVKSEAANASPDVADSSSDPPAVDAQAASGSSANMLDATTAVLPTPANLLIDPTVARSLGQSSQEASQRLLNALSNGKIGWAGGGPEAAVCLDLLTYNDAETSLRQAYAETADAIGTPPPVYARYAGSTPSDLTRVLVELGYVGMIPINFAEGTGFGDEAKVIVQSTAGDLEALMAKPIDAASNASFLTLGAQLGEAIDSGDIATGLLVRWPGQTCDAMEDLRRAASWTVALGRFWKLDDYFTQGERPYHHGSTQSASPEAVSLLESRAADPSQAALSGIAKTFCTSVQAEHVALLRNLTALVTGQQPAVDSDATEVARAFAEAVCGADVLGSSDPEPHRALLIANHHGTANRVNVTLAGHPPPKAPHIFASSAHGGLADVTVDVPACGFVALHAGQSETSGTGLVGKLRRKFLGQADAIADEQRLANEFMEVTISEQTGGIAGVYSGSVRGNRLSLRLVRVRPHDRSGDGCQMTCRDLRLVQATESSGCIETTGQVVDTKSKTALADYTLRYRLERGSRILNVEGQIQPIDRYGDEPWHDYLAIRTAVAGDAAICHRMVRDKVHRNRSRRIVAPLGVMIDEADRQTMVTADGFAFHRRVGERFLDTLIYVHGESQTEFRLHYGFDVPAPIAAARTTIAPPISVPLKPDAPVKTDVGWISHLSPKEVHLGEMKIVRRDDGKLAALVRLIQTQPHSCKTAIRFYRDVLAACRIPSNDPQHCNVDLPESKHAESKHAESKHAEVTSGETSSDDVHHDDAHNQDSPTGETRSAAPEWLDSQGDRVRLNLPSHGIIDLLVIFKS